MHQKQENCDREDGYYLNGLVRQLQTINAKP